MQEQFVLSSDAISRDLSPIGLAIHAILNNLPVTLRSRNNLGVKIEDGAVKSESYTGPILERVLQENRVIKTKPQSGDYKNVPVIVAPIRDTSGAAIAAIGVVDITGIFDLADFMNQQSKIIAQMRYCAVPETQT
ncbi:MAG: DUF2111 domain-containing protein [Euryarchaeota archaeon]|nr:DUF2111 domain-containing protein [Euryarchaeota archaeon]